VTWIFAALPWSWVSYLGAAVLPLVSWFKFRNVFHVSPYAATGGGRATFVQGIVEYHAVALRRSDQTSTGTGD
jgi:hypothetical protein